MFIEELMKGILVSDAYKRYETKALRYMKASQPFTFFGLVRKISAIGVRSVLSFSGLYEGNECKLIEFVCETSNKCYRRTHSPKRAVGFRERNKQKMKIN
jgi:hypothetical protein